MGILVQIDAERSVRSCAESSIVRSLCVNWHFQVLSCAGLCGAGGKPLRTLGLLKANQACREAKALFDEDHGQMAMGSCARSSWPCGAFPAETMLKGPGRQG